MTTQNHKVTGQFVKRLCKCFSNISQTLVSLPQGHSVLVDRARSCDFPIVSHDGFRWSFWFCFNSTSPIQKRKLEGLLVVSTTVLLGYTQVIYIGLLKLKCVCWLLPISRARCLFFGSVCHRTWDENRTNFSSFQIWGEGLVPLRLSAFGCAIDSILAQWVTNRASQACWPGLFPRHDLVAWYRDSSDRNKSAPYLDTNS